MLASLKAFSAEKVFGGRPGVMSIRLVDHLPSIGNWRMTLQDVIPVDVSPVYCLNERRCRRDALIVCR